MKINNIKEMTIPQSSFIVFITGVTGQDGSNMADYILHKFPNAHVIGGTRRLSVDNHENISHLENEKRFQCVNFDLTDSHAIYKVIDKIKPNYFINFAAQSFVASSWDLAKQTWETNATGVLDCLEAIYQSCPHCRFYNAGSSEEFGDIIYEPQDEKHPLRPRSPYGASKAAARQIVKVYRESHNIYAVQGWLFNHEGKRRGKQFVTRKISYHVAQIKKTIDKHIKEGLSFNSLLNQLNPIELGNLNSKRDWSDSEDMMDAVWRMLNQDVYNPSMRINTTVPFLSEEYNNLAKEKVIPNIKDYVTSSDESHTIREFVEEAFNVIKINGRWTGQGLDEKYEADINLNNEKQTVTLVKVNPVFYRISEVNTLRGNSNAIRKELGWNPTISFKELVKKMVEYDIQSSK